MSFALSAGLATYLPAGPDISKNARASESSSSVEFGGLRVHWVPGVIEPRQWTLHQSHWAAERLEHLDGGVIMELFSGAGHIGQEAARLTRRTVIQMDIESVAIGCSVYNADFNGLTQLVEHHCCDVTSSPSLPPSPPDSSVALGLVDAPYVPSERCREFPEDPQTAIDGGEDGLELTRSAFEFLDGVLDRRGEVIVQLGSSSQLRRLSSEIDSFVLVEERVYREDRVLGLLRRRQ